MPHVPHSGQAPSNRPSGEAFFHREPDRHRTNHNCKFEVKIRFVSQTWPVHENMFTLVRRSRSAAHRPPPGSGSSFRNYHRVSDWRNSSQSTAGQRPANQVSARRHRRWGPWSAPTFGTVNPQFASALEILSLISDAGTV